MGSTQCTVLLGVAHAGLKFRVLFRNPTGSKDFSICTFLDNPNCLFSKTYECLNSCSKDRKSSVFQVHLPTSPSSLSCHLANTPWYTAGVFRFSDKVGMEKTRFNILHTESAQTLSDPSLMPPFLHSVIYLLDVFISSLLPKTL